MAEPDARQMTPAQRSYEEKRARKAGMSLDKWLSLKEKDRAAEAAAARKTADAAKPAAPKKQNFFQRLMEKAEKPIR